MRKPHFRSRSRRYRWEGWRQGKDGCISAGRDGCTLGEDDKPDKPPDIALGPEPVTPSRTITSITLRSRPAIFRLGRLRLS